MCSVLHFKVGFKPAGGIRTAKDALTWLMLMKEELGDEWLKPELFRLGASSLLADIERQVSNISNFHLSGEKKAFLVCLFIPFQKHFSGHFKDNGTCF